MGEKALILLRGKAVDNGPEHPSEVDLLPWWQPEAGKHLLQRLGKAGSGIIQHTGIVPAEEGQQAQYFAVFNELAFLQ